MFRLLAVLHPLSMIVMLSAAAMLGPLAVALIFADGEELIYAQCIAITGSIGFFTWLALRRHRRELMLRDGFLLVTLVWTVVPAFATLPLLISIPNLSFTDAYFEAVSGITTTGSTVLSAIDDLPPSINFWRCELIWLGGMGLVVLAVAVLPLLGVGGMQIYKAETPGPMKDSKLTPRIAQTAKGLWLIYFGLTLACALALRAAGLSWFDAICHAFATAGLGGFSTHDAGFTGFNSVPVEMVTIFFMLLAGMNFATHFSAVRERSLRAYRLDPEAFSFLLVVAVAIVIITLYLWTHGVYPDLVTAFRYAVFNTVSIATTTGFSTTDYNQWPLFAPMLMLLLCCFATSSGSTGGGIKMVRAKLLAKQGVRELLKLLHPQAKAPVKLRGAVVSSRIIYAALAFMSLYGMTIVAMTFMMLASGLDFITGFSAVMASINNTGPGLGEVGPATNYAGLSDFQTWVCTLGMLLGRLELMTVFVVLTPAFWRK